MGDEGMNIETTLKAEPEIHEREVSVSNSSDTANGQDTPNEIDDSPEHLDDFKNPFSRTQTSADVTDYFVSSNCPMLAFINYLFSPRLDHGTLTNIQNGLCSFECMAPFYQR
jgi:hypothetical protein